MPYDLNLTHRIREMLLPVPGVEEKKMFGGVGFLIRGNMACGVHGDDLIVRLHAEASAQALARPHTKVFDMTGRPMKGWLMVEPAGVSTDPELQAWVDQAVAYAATLPQK